MSRFSGDIDGFRVWLFRIARHRGIDELRRAARRPVAAFGTDGDPVEAATPPAPDAAEEAVRRADTDWALSLISSLPPDQAEAGMLRGGAGPDAGQAGGGGGDRAPARGGGGPCRRA